MIEWHKGSEGHGGWIGPNFRRMRGTHMGEEKKKQKLRKLIIAGAMGVLLILAFFAGFFLSPLFKTGGQRDEARVDASAQTKETSGQEDGASDGESAQAGEETESESGSDQEESGTTAAGALTVTIGHSNEWGEEPHYVQLEGTITNGTDRTVEGWTVTVNVGDAALDQSWSGTCSIEGGILTITNVDYNSMIAPGGTCDFGLIIYDVTGDFAAQVTAKSFTDTADINQQNNQNQQGNQNGQQNTQENTTMLPVPDPTTDDWLSVKGNKIVDQDGNEVWLTGVNWFGSYGYRPRSGRRQSC